MTTTVQPTIPLTMGDPVGIGPEIIVKVLADPGRENRAVRNAGASRGPSGVPQMRAA